MQNIFNTYLSDFNDAPWQTVKLSYWDDLFEKKPSIKIQKRQIIFDQGDFVSQVYLIKSGRVSISLLNEEGNEKTCMILLPGSIIGIEPTLLSRPSSVTARSNTLSELQLLSREELLLAIEDNPQVSMQIMFYLSNISQVYIQSIKSSTYTNARENVIKNLIKLTNLFGVNTYSGIKITLKFTHQQMADLLGTSRVTVSKIMSELQKSNILAKKNGYYLVNDLNTLEELLNETKK